MLISNNNEKNMKNIIKIFFAINIIFISRAFSNSDAEQIEEACRLYNYLFSITHNYDKIISDIKENTKKIKHYENYTNAKIDDPNFCEILKNKTQYEFNQYSQSLKNTAQCKLLECLIQSENKPVNALFKKRNCQEYLTKIPNNTVTFEQCKELLK